MNVLYYSWREAARVSSLSEPTLRRMVKAGALTPPEKLGEGRVAFEAQRFEADLRAFVAKCNRPQAA